MNKIKLTHEKDLVPREKETTVSSKEVWVQIMEEGDYPKEGGIYKVRLGIPNGSREWTRSHIISHYENMVKHGSAEDQHTISWLQESPSPSTTVKEGLKYLPANCGHCGKVNYIPISK